MAISTGPAPTAWERRTPIDYIMLRCKASFRIASKHRKQPASVKKKLDVIKLNSLRIQHALSETLTENLQQLLQDNSDPDAEWAAFSHSL